MNDSSTQSSRPSSGAATASGDAAFPKAPIGNPLGAVGYAASADLLVDRKRIQQANMTAATVLHDPLMLQQLTDRVYDLLLEDLRQQRERTHNYGGFFS